MESGRFGRFLFSGVATIGITGGIASGKTTFRDLLRQRSHAEFFDADAAAKELLATDPEVRSAIQSRIHPAAYRADGQPDRAVLRELIFADAAHKTTLEEILHPRIRRKWLALADRARVENRLFVVDIPLLFEVKAAEHFDSIVTVACSPQTQMDRIVGNRGLSPEIASKIIASQLPMSAKIAQSDQVVWNDGSPENLIFQADLFSRYLHARYG